MKYFFSLQSLLIASVTVMFLVTAVPVTEPVPYHKGQQFRWQLLLKAVLGSIGVVNNGICVWLMLTLPKDEKVSFYRLNLVISISDFIFSIERVLFASLYLQHDGVYNQQECQAEGILSLFSMITTIFSVAGMSFVAKYDICNDKKFTPSQMNVFIVAYTLLNGCLLTFTALLPEPYGGFRSDFSGTYCFASWSAIVSMPVIYLFTILLPFNFICFNIYVIYRKVQKAQELLKQHSIQEQAKSLYITMVLKLLYFVVVTTQFYSLGFFISLYEFSTGIYFPALGAAINELMGMSLHCFVITFLFYYLNSNLRRNFIRKVMKPLIVILPVLKYFNNRKKNNLNVTAMKNSKVVPVRRLSTTTNVQSLVDKNDIELWSTDSNLRPIFEEYCRSHYVIENLLFLDYMRTYHELGATATTQFTDNKTIDEDVWKKLEEQAQKIFTLFIQPQSAPLEINIPDKMRIKAVSLLFPGSTKETKKYNSITFPPAESADIINNGYIQVYDDCEHCILKVIITDIWPRFIKTSGYLNALQRYVNTGEQDA